jgi:HK97 family phage major capsid protein
LDTWVTVCSGLNPEYFAMPRLSSTPSPKVRRDTLLVDMRKILDGAERENRDLTADEMAAYDSAKAEVETLNRQLDFADTQERLGRPVPTVAAHLMSRGSRARGLPGAEFETLGEFIHAVRFNPADSRLTFQEFPAVQGADQSMGEGARGGFAVPRQFRDELYAVSPQAGVFRPRATIVPAGDPPDAALAIPALDQTAGSTDAAKTYGGVSVNWIGEGAAKPQTDAKLREIVLTPKEVAGHIVLTDKLLRNWRSSGPVIEALLRGAVISAEEFAFLSGNGVGQPLGIINSGAAYVVNRGVTSTFSYADATAMLQRLLMRGGDPLWLLSGSVMQQLLTMRNPIGSPATGDGSLIWDPNARDEDGNQLFMGYPIAWHERSPVLGAKGDVILADLRGYVIKDGFGPFVAASEHVHFLENKTVLKIFWNVDGAPWLTAPMTLENGWQASPFVVLDVPS